MKKNFILKFVLICISLCISLNARTQTTAYQTYLDNGVFSATQAPTGEVRFPAEFEPVQSVMVVYPLELPWQLLQEISEDCKLVTVINRRKASSITIEEIKTEYTNNGVTISNCEFIIANNETLQDGINSHWIRDFGPWCIFNGKDVAIVDNVYNRSFVDDNSNPISSPSWTNGRWRDDQFAKTYATDNSIPLYGMEVVHTGGNMMQDGRGVGVSDLIVHTQSKTFAGLDEETVNQRMNDYLGIDTYHVTIDPQGDYIAHVDCWGKFLAPDKIIIARVPNGHEQYSAYEEVASYFASTNCCWGYPYKVYRVDIPVNKKSQIKDSDKIAPYTNCLILNDKVLVPISSWTDNSYNEAALAVYEEAMPGYEIVGIDYIKSDEYGPYECGWKNTDALHCRTRDIMDFNMLFVDHRDVLFGEQTYQESYPITAKFIAYSGDNITETKLHYSINGGAYTTVAMTATGNANEYAANITGHTSGANIKYYVTGEDASGRTCVQPQFGELEPHTFTAGAASGEEPEAITIEANPSNALVGDDIYFTVMQGGNNVTDEALFYIGKLKISNPYTPMYASTFTVRAEKDGLTAETTFTVAEPIEITASPTVITANGTDTVTFTVIQGLDDVTAVSKFFIGTTEISNPYTTTAAGTFTVRAEKDGLTDEITIIANAVQPGGDDNTGGDTSGDVVTIGDITTNATSSMIPIYTYYSKSISQQYYLENEIGRMNGTITSVAFHTATGDFSDERTISIYMKNTDASSFADKNLIAMENGDLVFEGDVKFALNQWVTIELTNEFNYTGSNILLCVYDQTGKYNDGIDFKTFGDNNDTRTRYQMGDASSNFSPIGKQISGRNSIYAVPCIQFTFGDAGSTTPVAPDAPTNLKAEATEATVTLTWDAVEGASYNVYQGGDLLANVTELTYTVENLTANTSYTFSVKAVKDELESDAATVTVKTLEPAPATPTNVVATANGQNSIVVTWGAVEGATDYYVYKDGTMWANTNGATTYTEKNLAAGTECCFAIKAVNGTLESELSETKCATTEAEQGGDDNTGDDNTGGDDTSGDVVTIGDENTSSKQNYLPIRTWAKYSISQQYYLKEEINKNDGGTISSIAFHTADGDFPCTRKLTIYMRNTDVCSFENTKMELMDESEIVFDEEVYFEANKWVTINLTNSFKYEGNKNILLCVYDHTDDYTENETYFKTHSVSGERTNIKNGGTITYPSSLTGGLKAGVVSLIQFTFVAEGSTTPVAPDAPTNLKAEATEATVTLTWDAVEGASYNVYQGEDLLANVTELTYTVKNLTANTSYTFSVKAVKDQLESDAATVTVKTLEPAPVAPATPTNVVATANGQNSITVTWDAVDGATDYYVYKGGQMWANTNGAITYTENGLAAGTECCFAVQAVNGTLESALSDQACATTEAEQQGGDDNTGGDNTGGDVVTIGGNINENTTSRYVPTDTYNKYTISQQYYTADEIGDKKGDIITHIAFIALNATPDNGKPYPTYTERSIDIYMGNVDAIPTSTEITVAESTTNVCSRTIKFNIGEWTIIKLDEPFEYTGKILSVGVNDKTGKYEDFKTNFATFTSDPYRAFYASNSNKSSAYDPAKEITFTESSQVPFIQLTFEEKQVEQEVITLEGNTTLIKADDTDKVTFTVTKEGLNKEVVTEESEIHISREGDQNETILNSTTGYGFTTTVAGNYTAYAMKGEAISNTVNFRAVYPIKITASTDTIVADNVDYVEFTVKQSAGQDLDSIDITNVATIYVDNSPLSAGVNTFKTNIIDTYYVYAEYDGITSNAVTVVAKSHINYDEDVEGSLDGEYFNPRGYVTYNKGEDNEYTLVAIKEEDSTATITEENVWYLGTGPGSMIELIRPNPHKPQADATLIIPEKILFDDNWVTVTEIEDYAFDNLFRFDSWNDYTPGDPLNGYFTNLIIPSTIDTVGTYSFAFNVDTYVICYAKTPPAVGKYPPFLQDTYKNAILYVPAPYVDDYKAAAGWGTGTSGDKNAGFVTILPIATPTFYIKGSWDNVNNWVQEYGYPDPGEDVIILEDARIENGTVADVGRVDIISGSITIADGGQLIHTNPGVTVTLEKEIKGYKGVTSPTSWYTISSPLYPSIEASSVDSLLSNDFDLYRYDEPTHYWDNIEDLLDTIAEGPHGNWTMLDAGRGYLYANNNDVTLRFNGVANHTGGIYTLTTKVWDGVLKGFHLVGNPFTHDIYMDNAFSTEAPLASGYYILSNTGAWSANLGSDTPIEPCQGVLIKAIEEGTLTINKKVGPATEAQTRSRSNNEFITISVSNKNYEDKAYVSFNAEYPLEKVNHQNKDIPMVYIPMEEDNYAIATMDNDVKEIPVAFEAKTMGQYTISAKAQNYDAKEMYLVDRMTGIETNLLLEDYTFMARTTDNNERFIVKLSNTNTDSENFIFINNGEMIINNIEGKGVLQIFDVMGRYISHTEVSGSANISTEAFTSGVYIIRMMDDNGVKTQKVVL